MFISYREAFLAKKPQQTKPSADWILVFGNDGKLTQEIMAYPHLLEGDRFFLTPGNYAVVDVYAIDINASGDKWSRNNPRLYYSPSLGISVNRANPEQLDQIYEKLSEVSLPVSNDMRIQLD